jgi:hypothetical protein
MSPTFHEYVVLWALASKSGACLKSRKSGDTQTVSSGMESVEDAGLKYFPGDRILCSVSDVLDARTNHRDQSSQKPTFGENDETDLDQI